MYVIRFTRIDKQSNEEYYYHFLKDALYHYSLFETDDSGLYSYLTLVDQRGKDKSIIMHKCRLC